MIHSGFLSLPQRHEFEACVRSHREDHGVARRANATLLLDDGESCMQIAKFLCLDTGTTCSWYKIYREGVWDMASVDGWKGGQSRLTAAQEGQLRDWLDGRSCRSTVEIISYISTEFILYYLHSGCPGLFARLGFEYSKPKDLPQVASAEKQVGLIEMYDCLMTERVADEAVYFTDAVHAEYQTKPAYGWVKAGSVPAVPTTAGRGRVNIHGALNLETFDWPFVEPTTVDGVSAAHLLAKIEVRNPDERIIHVIWDNAAYHTGPNVRKFFARSDCRIHLIQLPPYCPHLNPIERLWAVMYQFVTHIRHHPTQREIGNAIIRYFRETIPNEWKSFRSQVSDNFRVRNHEKISGFAVASV